MKKFILFLSGICLTTYLITLSIQYIADRGLKKQKQSIYEDWDAILDGKINADIVINGSSRAKFSYDARIISKETKLKVQNLGFNAGSYNLQKSKFDIYLKNNHLPKIIIQNIDLANFNEGKSLPDENQFFPFIDRPEIKKFICEFDSKFNYIGFIPLLKYNQNFSILKKGLLSNFKEQLAAEPLYFGFSPKKQSFKLDLHNFKKLKSEVRKKKYINARNLCRLNEILRFYQSKMKEDTVLIFVWAPEYKERLKTIYNPLREVLTQQLRDIENKNRNVFFVDFSHDIIAQDSGCFYDSFHLNEFGAGKFSVKLGLKINNIIENRYQIN